MLHTAASMDQLFQGAAAPISIDVTHTMGRIINHVILITNLRLGVTVQCKNFNTIKYFLLNTNF